MSSMPIRRSGSMFSPSAQIKALQNLNKSRITGQMALPYSPVGNEQARNSALAPAAGYSTTNPTGAQTALSGAAPTSFRTPQSATPSNPATASGIDSSPLGEDMSLVPPGGFTGAAPSIFTSPDADTLSSPEMVDENFNRSGGTIDRIRNAPITAVRRPEVVEDFERQRQERQSALDSAYQQGSVAATGMTPQERANWTPEQGYNFGSNLFDGARSGGAIGAGMARRFGSGSPLAAAEESSGPRRRMTDEEAMKKSEDAMKARVPERGILATPGTGFTRTDKYGNKAYTSRAQYAKDQLAAAQKANDVEAVQKWQGEVDQINKEQSEAKSRHESQKARWREAHGGMTEREYKKIRRMESAVSRGMIPQERLDAARADIQMKIDKGFGRSGSGSSALSNKPAVGVDGQFDAQTRAKAREGIKALVSPETASAPGEKQKTAAVVQQFGYRENDSFQDFHAKTASIPKETWDEILSNPSSVKDVFQSIKEFYRLQKEADRGFSHNDANEGRNGRFAAGELRKDAQRYEDMLGIDENDIAAMTAWVTLYRNSIAGGTDRGPLGVVPKHGPGNIPRQPEPPLSVPLWMQ